MKTLTELNNEIKKLTEARRKLLTQASKVPNNLGNAAAYLLATHAGRKLAEEEELGLGYCGSVSLEGHLEQIADPSSWVHHSLDNWFRKAASEK